MAGTTGLEPATSAVTGQHSNQLNYVPTAFSTTYRKVLILLAVLTVYLSPVSTTSTRYNRIPGFMDSIDSKKNLSELPSHKRPQTAKLSPFREWIVSKKRSRNSSAQKTTETGAMLPRGRLVR